MPDFENHILDVYHNRVDHSLNPWIKPLLAQKKITNEAELKKKARGLSEMEFLHFIRESVLVYAYALRDMHGALCPNSSGGVCSNMYKVLHQDTSSIMTYLERVNFTVNGEEFRFWKNNDGRPMYSIMNFQLHNDELYWIEVGNISGNTSTSLNLPFHGKQIYLGKSASTLPPSSACGTPCTIGQVRDYHKNKCCWRCVNCSFLEYVSNMTTCKRCPNHTVPAADRRSCIRPRTTYIFYDHPLVLMITTFAGIGVILTSCVTGVFIRYAHTPVIKASGRELSQVLLAGIFLSYGVVFTIMLKPSTVMCATNRFMYPVGYTLCYAAILTKTNRIARIFNAANQAKQVISRSASLRRPMSGMTLSTLAATTATSTRIARCSTAGLTRPRTPHLQHQHQLRYISPTSQLFIVTLIMGAQCLINAVWLALRFPEPDSRDDIDFEKETVTVYEICEAFEDEDMLVGLSFPLLLLCLTAYYAFRARKCPGAYNETKYIAVTMYTTCIIWLGFMPGYFATNKVPLRIFALSGSLTLNATVTLFCMFMPKVYIAVFRPHKNTRQTVLGRAKSQSHMSLHRSDYRGDSNSGPGSLVINNTYNTDQQTTRPHTNDGNNNLSVRKYTAGSIFGASVSCDPISGSDVAPTKDGFQQQFQSQATQQHQELRQQISCVSQADYELQDSHGEISYPCNDSRCHFNHADGEIATPNDNSDQHSGILCATPAVEYYSSFSPVNLHISLAQQISAGSNSSATEAEKTGKIESEPKCGNCSDKESNTIKSSSTISSKSTRRKSSLPSR